MSISVQYGKTIEDAQPLDDDFQTQAQNIAQASGYQIQVSITGTTIAGTLKLQRSVSYGIGITSPVWDDVPNSSEEFTDEGSFSYNVSLEYAPFFRLAWTDGGSSSDARIAIYYFEKG